jgi:microcystin-dependent protein
MNYFIGQIGIFGFNFAPRGWALCSGTLLAITQNTALFSLIGTTYGGNGQTTFGLPDLRSRTPIMFGNLTSMGEMAGVENVTLTTSEMPDHTHTFEASNNVAKTIPLAGNVFAGGEVAGTAQNSYAAPPQNTALNPGSLSMAGGSQPHNNIQPSLAVNFCIATTGNYPSRN